ncbi:MAG TPA: type 4a pilus biogenesis protein PilO [Candidatus Paceibacterota bacterium]|nr:type 4a pilus biogenesis protein PilO [Candidatus Paceibacterota bacterium]
MTRSLFGAFAIAIALFSFWPFVVGRYQQISALREAVQQRESLVQERQESLDNIASELGRYASEVTGDDVDKFSAMVPDARGTAELVSALDAMALSSGMVIAEARLAEARARQGDVTRTVTITLDMQGRYENFKTFLGELERSVRLLNVNTIEITEDIQRPGQQRYSVRADAYFLR